MLTLGPVLLPEALVLLDVTGPVVSAVALDDEAVVEVVLELAVTDGDVVTLGDGVLVGLGDSDVLLGDGVALRDAAAEPRRYGNGATGRSVADTITGDGGGTTA